MGMTDRDKKLMAIFAVVVLLGGYWFLVLGKKRAAVAEAEQSKISAQKALDDAKNAAQAGKREKKRYPVSYSRVVRLGKAIPEQADLASLIVQVSDISDETGVRFESLVSSDTPAAGGATAGGATGGVTTTCGESGATASTGAAAGATGGATGGGATGSTGSTGPTQANNALGGLGRAINHAHVAAGTASTDASNAAAASAEQAQAKRCAGAPTLTDLAAASAGLRLSTFSFKFKGNFFNLHEVIHRLMGMVETRGGKVKVAGRLLQINAVNLTSSSFPDLDAQIDMTGYMLPDATSLTAGATPSGPAGAPTSNSTPSATPPAS